MSIQRINFTQNYAQIGISGVAHANMQINTPGGQMTINEQRPQLDINTEMPTFRQPTERLRNEMGLATPLRFAKNFRDKGKQVALQAAGAYAADGDFLANKNIPGDKSVPMLSKNKMKRALQARDKNIGLMPSSPPSLEWTRGQINVSASRHSVAVNWNGSNMANVTVQNNFPVQVSTVGRTDFTVNSIQPSVEKRTTGYYFDRMV